MGQLFSPFTVSCHDAGGSSSSIPESFESTRESWRGDRSRFSTFYLPRSGTPLLADQITLDPRASHRPDASGPTARSIPYTSWWPCFCEEKHPPRARPWAVDHATTPQPLDQA